MLFFKLINFKLLFICRLSFIFPSSVHDINLESDEHISIEQTKSRQLFTINLCFKNNKIKNNNN